jgi:hypothetical protein
MSALEAAVAPWILSVKGSADLALFQEDDRRLAFARWALKTACVLDRVGGMGEIGPEISSALFKQQDALPDNINVLVGFHDWTSPTLFSFNQRNQWTRYPLTIPCPDPNCNPDGRSFKVAFAINRLMVLVVGVPDPHFHLVIGTGTHVPIWPNRNIPLHYWFHSLRTEGVDPEKALSNFSDLVAVAHGGRMR